MSNEVKPSEVRIETSEYVRSHGKEPRGKGLWFISPMSYGSAISNEERDAYFSGLIRHNGTLTEAKNHAKKVLASRGFRVGYVCP